MADDAAAISSLREQITGMFRGPYCPSQQTTEWSVAANLSVMLRVSGAQIITRGAYILPLTDGVTNGSQAIVVVGSEVIVLGPLARSTSDALRGLLKVTEETIRKCSKLFTGMDASETEQVSGGLVNCKWMPTSMGASGSLNRVG